MTTLGWWRWRSLRGSVAALAISVLLGVFPVPFLRGPAVQFSVAGPAVTSFQSQFLAVAQGPFGPAQPLACPAFSLAVRSHISVLGREFVPTRAVANPEQDTAPEILLYRHGLKVCWVDTATVPAEMVNRPVRWDRADQLLVREAMGTYEDSLPRPSTDVVSPIAIGAGSTRPFPARSPVVEVLGADADFLAESLGQGADFHARNIV